MADFTDIGVETHDHVALIEICRPPHNFFDPSLIQQIATALEEIDRNANLRCTVLAAQGRSFCAGANFSDPARKSDDDNEGVGGGTTAMLYREGIRLFQTIKPIVGAIHGPAIGGGLGVALVADFRVTCPEARFAANFARLGYHPGFGLTVVLPELIGRNRAELMMYTGRRLGGEEATAWGLANLCVPQDRVRSEAIKLASEIAECAPLAIAATRATMRQGLVERIKQATEIELAKQDKLRRTEDFKEGVKATAERRLANWQGR